MLPAPSCRRLLRWSPRPARLKISDCQRLASANLHRIWSHDRCGLVRRTKAAALWFPACWRAGPVRSRPADNDAVFVRSSAARGVQPARREVIGSPIGGYGVHMRHVVRNPSASPFRLTPHAARRPTPRRPRAAGRHLAREVRKALLKASWRSANDSAADRTVYREYAVPRERIAISGGSPQRPQRAGGLRFFDSGRPCGRRRDRAWMRLFSTYISGARLTLLALERRTLVADGMPCGSKTRRRQRRCGGRIVP